MGIPERRIETAAFLAEAGRGVVLDARSPGEFAEAHFPGALSFPVFDDAERAEVGTLYKQVGRNAAVERGLEFIGPKMANLVRQARALFEAQSTRLPLLIYCWRGGMRSDSLSWLLRTAGLPVYVLEGGYKAYKAGLSEQMGRPWLLIRIGGYTGAGKTEALLALGRNGEQIVDLEGLAKHFGSAFGNLDGHAQPSSEHFRNLLDERLRALDPSRPIWVENESRKIGTVHLPEEFYKRMIASPTLEMKRTLEDRVQHLVQMYSAFDSALLKNGFTGIAQRLSELHGKGALQKAHDAVDRGDLAEAATMALAWYDPTYQHGLDKRAAERRISVDCEGLDFAQCADRLLKAAAASTFSSQIASHGN
jgi:tRNA 2-selenouridine synthase